MLRKHSPLIVLRQLLANDTETPVQIAAEVAIKSNGNASHNTYIYFNTEALFRQAQTLSSGFPDAGSRPLLYGVPISLKDCFDLAGTTTTCGSRFYAKRNSVAQTDSAMARRLRGSGALITGKTHLHPLAYGITGQNPEYGDCLQPRDSSLLTGGSSSGAAASVQEGSALAAIGTDTGGSVRVPAALCGLVGYRASLNLASKSGGWPDLWDGGTHLAPSFDTVGLLLRDPRDAAPIANAVFGVPVGSSSTTLRIGCVPLSFLTGCEEEVLATYDAWRRQLAIAGATLTEFDTTDWRDSLEVFAGIQAHEAAAIHHGHYDEFEPLIAQRLRWGASLTESDLAPLRERLTEFRSRISELFGRLDLLMLPASPVSRLRASEDQSSTRQAILRYTTPFSLAGVPVVSMPGEIIGSPFGTGVQIAAAPGSDGSLLAYVASIGNVLADSGLARSSGSAEPA